MSRPSRDSSIEAFDRIREDALDRLSHRAMSRSKLREALIRRWGNHENMMTLLDDLTRAGLLDDPAFAREAIRQELAKSPASAAFLEERLIALGVDEPLAHDEAAKATAPIDLRSLAIAFAHRRRSSFDAKLPTASVARRLASALARRGFDSEFITDVLADVLGEWQEL